MPGPVSSTPFGVLACTAGGLRVAFDVHEVQGIDDELDGAVRLHTAEPSPSARRVRLGAGGVVVDEAEVAMVNGLLQVPPMLRALVGGALAGFVPYRDQLWPVLSAAAVLKHFAREAP